MISPRLIRKHSKTSIVMAIAPKDSLDGRSSSADVFLRTAAVRFFVLTSSFFLDDLGASLGIREMFAE